MRIIVELLGKADEAGPAYRRTVYEAGRPATSLTTEDVRGDYERRVAAAVTFTMAPTVMPYGGTDAVLDDGCGNLICLHQD